MKKVSIIIPVYNQVAYTEKCLKALYDTGSDELAEIIVVDNASTDQTSVYLKSQEPRIVSIRNEKNLGFGGACNAGAKEANGQVLVFLNNDTEVHKDWLKQPVKHLLKNPNVGIVGSKLLYPDGTIQHAGIHFIARPDFKIAHWPDHRFRGVPQTDSNVNRCEPVSAVTAACLFITRELFWRVGGFPEEYHMYFEDVDLNLKVRSLGYQVIYEPSSVVTHYERRSTANETGNELMANAARIFYSKWSYRLTSLANPDPTPRSTNVKWIGNLAGHGGYSTAMRNHALNLASSGFQVQVDPVSIQNSSSINGVSSEILRLLTKPSSSPKDICITSFLPFFESDKYSEIRKIHSDIKAHVGYTMFETDRIPSTWVATCNQMNEVWVPSAFNQKTFASSGVDPEKLHVVPLGVDTSRFNPEYTNRLNLAPQDKFVFLSMFEWSQRKGWDVLLKAYLKAFNKSDPVALILHATSPIGKSISEEIQRFIKETGKTLADCPTITISESPVSVSLLPALYKSADVFVLPTRGEGWGLPIMEAMAMELPVIATGWSAHMDFLDGSNGYLIDYDLAKIPEEILGEPPLYKELYSGHCWAEPRLEHAASLMQKVFENREEARQKGISARQTIVQKFDSRCVTAKLIEQLERLGKKMTSSSDRPAVASL